MALNIVKPLQWCPGIVPGGHHLRSGLVAYWPLWEGFGAEAMDSSDNGEDGTFTNAPTWVSSEIGTAVNFVSGSSQYVSFPLITFGANADWTTSVWMRPTAVTNWRTWLGHGPPSNFTRQVVQSGGAFKCVASDNTGTYTAAGLIIVNLWQLVSFRRQGGNTSYSINGAPWTVIDAGVAAKTYNWAAVGVGYYYFDGQIGSAAIWDRALLASEIEQLYCEPWALITPPDRLTMWAGVLAGGAPPGGHPYYYDLVSRQMRGVA